MQLASLILHMTPEEWPDPVPQLISTFQSLPNVTVGIAPINMSPMIYKSTV